LAFRVDITDLALADASAYVSFIRDVRKEPEAAEKWFRGLVDAIYSRERAPERCPSISEARYFPGQVVRHSIYHSHRIVYGVDIEPNRVTVYRVYHGSRRPLSRKRLLRAE
jgi:plasmid stabilization system protein ParE